MERPVILIVEDEIIIARELEARLRAMGYGVAGIASTGPEALRLAESTSPNLVLMDIVLKGDMDGIEAATEIRRRLDLPVIYVTAYTDKGTLDRAKITDPFGYIVKPFSERELNANIEMGLYRHRAETKLRRLERWLTTTADSDMDAVIHTDREGRITLFNPAAEALTKWKSDQALGQPLREVMRLVDRANGKPVTVDPTTEGPVVCVAEETGLLDKSESMVPVDSTTSCVRDNENRPAGTISVVRRQADHGIQALVHLNRDVAQAAAKSPDLREMLRACTEALVRNLNVAFARIWTLDSTADTLVLQASAGMYTHLDGPHSRVPVGKFKIGLIAKERKPHLTNDVLRDRRIGDPEWAKREGMVAFAGYPLLANERLLGVVAMFARHPLADIVLDTLGSVSDAISVAIERRQAEAERDQAQQRLQRVVTSSPAVLFTLAGDSAEGLTLTWISVNVAEMLGYPLDEVYQPDWWRGRVHPEDLGAALSEIQSVLFPRGRLLQEYRFRRSDDEYRWVRSEMRLLRNDSGDPVEVVGSWSDITEHKQLEQQFRQAQKMEAVGQLAGGVAHDFNNLLTVISGCSQLLLAAGGLDDRKKGLIGEIGKAGDRAAALTRQLLAFSRKQVLELKILDLNALIADQEKMLRRLIGEDVAVSIVPGVNVSPVRADAGQLEQVIINLAVNARDAMPEGGRLTIETSNQELDEAYAQLHPEVQPGDYVLLSMSDTGTGMPPETQARIFEPFFTTKGLGKGTGLGLATVHGIVKQSNGHIAVYSEQGVGTSFKIYLPSVRQRQARDETEARASKPRGGTETILLVEDEGAVRAISRYALESCGYVVLEAGDGAEALRLCERHEGTVHLLVTDVVMPEMGGRPLTERLTKLRPGLKVLFTSGYTDDAVIRHGVLEAYTAFLQKPFTPEALTRKVREVLDQQGSSLRR